ncbi:MAG: amino acid adenylation domain-containing protein, partial [Clostridiales bacterium]
KIEYLEKSINYVIKRHEVLRTKIITTDGNATQKILPEKSCTIRKINLPEDLNDPDRIKNIILEIILKDAKTPFNISEDLFRIHIIKVKENDHVVLLNMHHIISDGWSSVIFIREIAEIYSSFEKQNEIILPPLNIQYADYSIWQRELLKNEKFYTELIHYWKEKLENINTTTLESDFTRPEVQSFNGKHIVTRLKPEITSKLEELAGKNNVTPFMLLLSAFNLLLYKYTGQTDIIVGTPVANRDHPDIENLIGFFVNTIVLRTQFSESDSFTHLLDKVRETTLGAYSHQQMPFNKLVEEINPERNTSHTPLFQIMFMMQNIPQKKVEPIKGLTIETLEVENELSTFDLSIIVEKDSGGLAIAAEFNKDLYKESTISSFLSQYAYLLEQLSFNSMKTLKEYSLIKEEEKRKILNELSNVEIVNGTIISEMEGRWEDRSIAIKEKGKEISYRELEERTNKLSRYIIGKLSKEGVESRDNEGRDEESREDKSKGEENRGVKNKKEVLIGISLDRSAEMIISIIGVLKSSSAYVPLDPEYPIERLSYIIEDSSLSVIVTEEKYLEKFEKIKAELKKKLLSEGGRGEEVEDIKIICIDKDRIEIERQSSKTVEINVDGDSLAYVIYTSGTTGNPKGVMVSHSSVVNHNRSVRKIFGLTNKDRVLQFATINFDAAVEEIFPALQSGATLILREKGLLQTAHELMQLVKEEEITLLDLPTAYWSELTRELSESRKGDDSEEELISDTLRVIVLGGERLTTESYMLWRSLKGSDKVRLINTYGPTETTVISTYYELNEREDSGNGEKIPIGRAIDNTRLYVLDKKMNLLPYGITGELYIGGIGLSRGYMNNPSLTAEYFLPDPFSNHPGSRIYRTGDKVREKEEEKALEFIGRVDEQLKIRGFRIEPEEIETLAMKHPSVAQAAVIAKDGPNGQKQLIVFVVEKNKDKTQSEKTQSEKIPLEKTSSDKSSSDETSSDKSSFEESVREYLRGKLPSYMMPNSVVSIEKLPLTRTGKLDRNHLKGIQVKIDSSRNREYVCATNLLEEELIAIWSELLSVDKISITDNFFELGGHSLLAIQLITRINRKLKCQVPLRNIFDFPILKDFAEEMKVYVGNEKLIPIIQKVNRDGNIPLSLAQERLWVLDQLEPGKALYNIPSAY